MNTNNIRKKINYYNRSNNMNNNYISTGKIKEKLIVINNGNIPEEKKIKEYEIIIKNNKANEYNLRRQKSDNLFKINKIRHIKTVTQNKPYLKPKLEIKNKNSFTKKNNNIKKCDNFNEEIKNIYLNFFKVYYDENGKKVKIIKNKTNYKENGLKEIVLTQNNNELKNERNDNNLEKNFKSYFLEHTCNNSINKKEKNFQNKNLGPETLSQSTASEIKSNINSIKDSNKEETYSNNINYKKNVIKNKKENNQIIKNILVNKKIHNDLLPKSSKRIKKHNKNDIKLRNIDVLNINNKERKLPFYKESLNKLRNINNKEKQSPLISKIKNKNADLNLSDSVKSNFKKINYFHNDISNLTVNRTFEQNNITDSLNEKNSNLKNIYISSFEKKNMKKDLINNKSVCSFNIGKENNKNNSRHSVGIHGNYFFFNFLKDNTDMNRNKSFGNKIIKNYNTKIDSNDSSIKTRLNLSFNKNDLFRNNISRFSNTYNDKENEINILNKTKEILKIKEDKINSNKTTKDFNFLTNSQSFLGGLNNPYLGIKNNILEKGNIGKNEIRNNIQKKDNCGNTYNKILNDNNFQGINISLLNKNKRPCSLYINKKQLIGKKDKNEIKSNNFFSLNDYYNSAIDKSSHLNNNIIIQNKNKINNNDDSFQHESIKRNLYDRKFINLSQNSSSKQLFNKRIKMN